MRFKFENGNPLPKETCQVLVSIVTEGFTRMREERDRRKIGEGNYFGLLLHDCFLEEIGKKFPETKIIFFNRFSYRGRMVYIPELGITISFGSKQGIKKAVRRSLGKPHYLQSLFYCLNGEFSGLETEECLFPLEQTDGERLEELFVYTYEKYIPQLRNCKHYVVEYSSHQGFLQDIRLNLYSSNLGLVNTWSLNEYIIPDAGELTEEVKQTNTFEHTAEINKLVKKKKGVDLDRKRQELERIDAE